MRIPRLALLALLVVPAPSTAQLPVIVIPDDPTVHDDRVAVNHFISAFRDLGIDVVDYVEPGDIALEVVVQSVRRTDRQFHVVVVAISYLRRLPDHVEARTRPALAVNSGSSELENLIRTMAEDVSGFLAESGDGSDLFPEPTGGPNGGTSLGAPTPRP